MTSVTFLIRLGRRVLAACAGFAWLIIIVWALDAWIHRAAMSENTISTTAPVGAATLYDSHTIERPGTGEGLLPLCSKLPHNTALPFYWFCSNANESLVRLEGPTIPVTLEHVGRIHNVGPHIYMFHAKEAGQYRLMVENNAVSTAHLKRDDCFCPESWDAFRAAYQCHPDDSARVGKYFEPWLPNSLSLDTFTDLGPAGNIVARYAIINNELYSTPDPPPALWSTTKILKSMLRKVKVPDVEFYMAASDAPVMEAAIPGPPVIAFSGEAWKNDILVPTPYTHHFFDGGHLREACLGGSWESRIRRGYFRGRNTGFLRPSRPHDLIFHQRLRAGYLSQTRPDILDVKVLLYPSSFPDDVQEVAQNESWAIANATSPHDYLNYTWQVVIDGNTAPWRTCNLMISGSLVLKQDSRYTEYFYDLLKPKLNYVPFKSGLSDLVEKLEWAKSHDHEAYAISERALNLVLTRMRVEDMLCWFALVMNHIHAILAFTPQVREGMIKPNQTDQSGCICENI